MTKNRDKLVPDFDSIAVSIVSSTFRAVRPNTDDVNVIAPDTPPQLPGSPGGRGEGQR